MPSNYYCKLCNYNTRVYNSYKIHLDSKTHSNNLVTSIIENKVSTTRPTSNLVTIDNENKTSTTRPISNLVTIDNENNSKSDIENIYIKFCDNSTSGKIQIIDVYTSLLAIFNITVKFVDSLHLNITFTLKSHLSNYDGILNILIINKYDKNESFKVTLTSFFSGSVNNTYTS